MSATEPGNRQPVVFIIEDEQLIVMFLTDLVEDLGMMALSAMSVDEARSVLESRSDIDVVSIDIALAKGGDGLALANEISERWPHIGVIISSGYGQPQRMPPGAIFLNKPYHGTHFADAIASHFAAR